MNRQKTEQVRFFLESLAGRFAEDMQIREIDASFTSGLKPYTLEAVRDADRLAFHFGGNAYEMTYPEFCAFLVRQAPEYDALEVVFRENGRDTVLEADNRRVATKTRASAAGQETSPGRDSFERASSMSNRKYYVKPENAAPLLRALGILGQNGKVRNDKVRKYNQIDHFIELMDAMLRRLAEEKRSAADRTVSVVDCACGKSYLSFALYYYMRDVLGLQCHFTGLDYNPVVIDDSKRIAAELGYTDMQFVETDIRTYVPDRHFDLLITLHACDTATDKALRFALHHGVRSIVCVPCCHREMNAQNYTVPGLERVLQYGILKARIADSLTDGLRALYLEAMGYDVSMVEYISPLDTPKNLMMRAERVRGFDAARMAEFDAVCTRLGVSLSIANE